MRFLRILTVLFCLHHPLHAADPNVQLDPATLKPQWWERFTEAPGAPGAKGQQLVSHIQTIIQTMSDDKKTEALDELERMRISFSQLEKVTQAQPIAIPPVTPSAESYPIDETLEIARKVQAENLVIKNLKDERSDRINQINRLQDELDRLAKGYFRQTEPNEEHFIQGLKLINTHIELLAAKDQLQRVESGIKGYESYLKRLTEELDLAESRLSASPEELSRVMAAKDGTQLEWHFLRSLARQQEADRIIQSADSDSSSTSVAGRLMDQQIIEASTQEMKAHEEYLMVNIKEALLSLILDPKAVNLDEVLKKSQEWTASLNDITQRLNKFVSTSQKEVQRTGQLISLAGGEADNSKEKTQQQEVLNLAQNNLLQLQKLKSQLQDSKFLLAKVENRLTKEIGGSKRFGQIIVGYFSYWWSTLGDWIETPLFHIGTKPVHLSSLIKFLSILLLTFWGSSKIVNGLNHWGVTKKRIEKSLLYRISRLLYYFLLTIGFIIALTSLGFDFSSFLIIAGALGVGLGFGLQTIFNNIMSGLILLFESQVKVGDFVEIASGTRGEIKEINVRSTIIATPDGLDVIVPNSEMVSTRVTNWSLTHPYRRLRIPFTVTYDADKEVVKKVITEGASKMPLTLVKPGFSDPDVMMKEFGTNGVTFELFVWVNEKYAKRPFKATSEYLWMIDTVLNEHGIEIPYNKVDLRLI